MQNLDAHEIYYQLLREEHEALREAKSYQQWTTLFENKRSRIRAIKNFNASRAKIESRGQIDSTILREEEQCLKEFDDVIVNHYATNTQQTRMVDAFRLSDEDNQPFYDVTVVITLTRLNKDARQLPRECFLTYRLQDDIIERQAQLGPPFNTQNCDGIREEKIETVEHDIMSVTQIVRAASQEQCLQNDIIECKAQLESSFDTRNCEEMREVKIETAEYPRMQSFTQSANISSSLTTITPQDTMNVTRIITSASQEQQTTLQKSPETIKSFQMQIVSQEDTNDQRLCSSATPIRKTKHEIQRMRFHSRVQQQYTPRIANTDSDITNNTRDENFTPKRKRMRVKRKTPTETIPTTMSKAYYAAIRKRDVKGRFIKGKILYNQLSKLQEISKRPLIQPGDRGGRCLTSATAAN